MKRVLLLVLCTALMLSVVGCANKVESHDTDSLSTGTLNSNPAETLLEGTPSVYDREALKQQAYEILNSLSYDKRVSDFIAAADILKNLSNEKNAFISELEKVKDIADKYDIELKYLERLLDPNYYFVYSDDSLTYSDTRMYEYISEDSGNRRHDMFDLLEGLVYPVLFDVYGNSAEQIPNIDIELVRRSFRNSGYTELSKTNTSYSNTREEWKSTTAGQNGTMTVDYHSNGAVKSVTLPLAFAQTELSDSEFEALYDLPLEKQKAETEKIFLEMAHNFSEYSYCTEILNAVFEPKELEVLKNYISSLTADDIWRNNLLSYNESEPDNYILSTLSLYYSGKKFSLSFSPFRTEMTIISSNQYNELSHNYYTVLCGVINVTDSVISMYQDYIYGDESLNESIADFTIDLNAVEEQYLDKTADKSDNSSEDNKAQESSEIVAEYSGNEEVQSARYYYDKGCEYLNSKQYLNAIDAFARNLDYSDTKEKYKEANYLYGEELLNQGNPLFAEEYFGKAGDYKDASTRVKRYYYEYAEKLFENHDYLAAAETYANYTCSYLDSNEKALECYYQYGKQQLALNYVTDAVTYLSKCRGYKDTDDILLSFYYSEASNAVNVFMKIFSQYSFTRDIENAYNNAISYLNLCEGYKDSKTLLKIVEKLYTAWSEMPERSNYEATLSEMTANYSSDVVSITQDGFMGQGCNISLTCNVSKNTFEADIYNMFNSSVREYDARNVLSSLLVLFTDIQNTDDFIAIFSDENNWAISEGQESFSMLYGGYTISVQTTHVKNYYIDCKISVQK